ncbi:hypothetical protein ScPMuIL_013329 [Solemya velum]
MGYGIRAVGKWKFVYLSVFVVFVYSQETDYFGTLYSHTACTNDRCAENKISCEKRDHALIQKIVYRRVNSTAACDHDECKKCCASEGTTKVYQNKSHSFQIYRRCSGKHHCSIDVPDIQRVNDGGTSVEVNYHCIKDDKTIKFCEDKTINGDSVHIMYSYSTSTDDFMDGECSCSILVDSRGSSVELYAVDTRLQTLTGAEMGCTNATLRWSLGEFKQQEECTDFDDRPVLRKMYSGSFERMWLTLDLQEDTPDMVWVMAKASKGKVAVECRDFARYPSTVTRGLTPTQMGGTTSLSAVSSHPSPTNSPHQFHHTEAGTLYRINATQTTPNSTELLPDPETSNNRSGVIVGAVLSTILAVAIVVLVMMYVILKRRSPAPRTESQITNEHPGSAAHVDNQSITADYSYILDADNFYEPMTQPGNNGYAFFGSDPGYASTKPERNGRNVSQKEIQYVNEKLHGDDRKCSGESINDSYLLHQVNVVPLVSDLMMVERRPTLFRCLITQAVEAYGEINSMQDPTARKKTQMKEERPNEKRRHGDRTDRAEREVDGNTGRGS